MEVDNKEEIFEQSSYFQNSDDFWTESKKIEERKGEEGVLESF